MAECNANFLHFYGCVWARGIVCGSDQDALSQEFLNSHPTALTHFAAVIWSLIFSDALKHILISQLMSNPRLKSIGYWKLNTCIFLQLGMNLSTATSLAFRWGSHLLVHRVGQLISYKVLIIVCKAAKITQTPNSPPTPSSADPVLLNVASAGTLRKYLINFY